jgi:hypothetical protein
MLACSSWSKCRYPRPCGNRCTPSPWRSSRLQLLGYQG